MWGGDWGVWGAEEMKLNQRTNTLKSTPPEEERARANLLNYAENERAPTLRLDGFGLAEARLAARPIGR